MEWIKSVSPGAADQGGWRDDFPLDANLPGPIRIDLAALRMPIHPIFALRIQIFCDWHRRLGKDVTVEPPGEPSARSFIAGLGLEGSGDTHDDVVAPIVRVREFGDVERLADNALQAIEYELDGAAISGKPAHMAISELAQNAVEHGTNELGAYVAVARLREPRQQLVIAIADLGIGVPEHIRQQHPEWADDTFAIAQATEASVSGTGKSHRGYGFDAVFDEVLIHSVQEATIDVLSANGFFRMRLCDGRRMPEGFPAARYRRGTWISCQLLYV